MWSSDRKAGFTLIETVTVMLIIALMASLAITMMPGTGRARLKAVTLEAAALLRRERLGAMLTGRERDQRLDQSEAPRSPVRALLARFSAPRPRRRPYTN